MKVYRLQYLICFLFLMETGFNTQLYSQTAEEYYRRGLELKNSGNIEGAIEAFKAATGRKYTFSDAYYQLGLCYLSKMDSYRTLLLAEETILKARRYASKDSSIITINLTLGDVYMARTYYDRAKRLYEEILTKDPGNIQARLHLAYYYREKRRTGIKFSPYTEKEDYLGKEIALYNAVLQENPLNREALFGKGQICYETGQIAEFITIFENVLTIHPNDKDAHIFLGLGYSILRNYTESLLHYTEALELMGSDERAMFENTAYFDTSFTLKSKRVVTVSSGNAESDYWNKKDPLMLTYYNERQLEHYRRVAEANLLFACPKHGLAGWQTDKGMIYIKYGKPQSISSRYIASEIEFGCWESWGYKDFGFNFRAGYAGVLENKYAFNILIVGNIEYTKAIIATYPETYTYEPPGKWINGAANAVSFRGDSGVTAVELTYGFPASSVSFEKKNNKLEGEINCGIFILDSTWTTIDSAIQTVPLSFDSAEITSNVFLTYTNRFDVAPGQYYVSIEFQDSSKGNTGVIRDTLAIEKFGYDTLQISECMVAYSIDAEFPLQLLSSRDEFKVIHSLQHIFYPGQPFFLYYELYNLAVTGVSENHHYKLEYRLTPSKIIPFIKTMKITVNQAGNVVERAVQDTNLISLHTVQKTRLLRYVAKAQQKTGVSEGNWVSMELQGTGDVDQQILRIEHSYTQTGAYLLILRITDLMSGQSAERLTPILLVAKR